MTDGAFTLPPLCPGSTTTVFRDKSRLPATSAAAVRRAVARCRGERAAADVDADDMEGADDVVDTAVVGAEGVVRDAAAEVVDRTVELALLAHPPRASAASDTPTVPIRPERGRACLRWIMLPTLPAVSPGTGAHGIRWRVRESSTSHHAHAGEAEGFSDPDRLAGAVIS